MNDQYVIVFGNVFDGEGFDGNGLKPVGPFNDWRDARNYVDSLLAVRGPSDPPLHWHIFDLYRPQAFDADAHERAHAKAREEWHARWDKWAAARDYPTNPIHPFLSQAE